jgi:hypothetical protein
MAERLSRKNLKHDKFVDEMNVAYDYLNTNRRNMLLGAAGIVAIVLIVAAISFYRSHKESTAQARLAEAIDVMDAPVGPPSPGVTAPTYKSEDEKIAKATPLFQGVVNSYGGTAAADMAELYLARVAAAKGDSASARPRLERFIREHPGTLPAGGAQFSLYQMDIVGGNAKEVAMQIEQKLNDEKKLLPTDVMLDLLARAYQASGEASKAREAYRRLATDFPDSPYAMEAQRNAPTA